MSVRIEKDGWTITGSSKTDLQMGIEAVQRALENNTDTEGRKRGRPPRNGVSPKERDKDFQGTVLNILNAISDNAHGIDAAMLMKVAKITSQFTIGPTMRKVSNVLHNDLKLNQKSVYDVEGYTKSKRWVPRDNIQAAIKKLEETIEET